MRRFDKKKHIERLNKRLNETTVVGHNINENKNQNKDQKTHSHTWKLSELFLDKYKGVELCGGTVERVDVLNDEDTMRVIIDIKCEEGVKTNAYDITNDEMDIKTGPMDRKSAKLLSKIALKFNPNTKYNNFMDEFEVKEYHTETMTETFQKLCGVNILSEATKEKIYFETLHEALEAVREKAEDMGYSVDEDDIWSSFGTGGIPYETNKSGNIKLLKNGEPILNKRGKPLNRALHVSIYRMASGKYELTCYKTW